MKQKEIELALYQKYVEPTKKKRKRCMGIEIEMPIVNLKNAPVEETNCFKVAQAFQKEFGFVTVGTDANDQVYSMSHPENDDNLSFDCSYSNLELSLGKVENLYDAKARFEQYYLFLNKQFKKYEYTLTGMGINPNYNINYNRPIPNERYRMLFHYLHSYKRVEADNIEHRFCERADFGTFTSASQVQIDVEYESLIDTINTFGKLEPYKAILFGNSVMKEYPDYMLVRNMLWEHSMHGVNKHNIGMYERELKDIDDLLAYIKTTSIYCVMRDGKYVDFQPIPIYQYMEMDQVNGEYFDGEKYCEISITPQIEDIEYLRSFKFEDLTYRGTIEFRSSCCQPIADSMTVAAFHMGLVEELPRLKKLLSEDEVLYHQGYSATELQKLMSKRYLPPFVNRDKLKEQLYAILDIAKQGLISRNVGEEALLVPLYERAGQLTNPAKEMLSGLENGKEMKEFILAYSGVK